MARGEGRSLALVVTVWTALVIAGGMAFYGVYQHLYHPGKTIQELALEHGLHVLALGTAIYLALNTLLYRKVIRPIHELNVTLYAISKGDFRPISVESRVREIREIARVVSFLLAQFEKALPEGALGELASCGDRLRNLARETEALETPQREELIEIANQVGQIAERLSTASLQGEGE